LAETIDGAGTGVICARDVRRKTERDADTDAILFVSVPLRQIAAEGGQDVPVDRGSPRS
jgi:hypothetical protein